MGAVFAVPLAKVHDPNELPGTKVALVPREGLPLNELCGSGSLCVNYDSKVRGGEVSLLVGSEREGLPPDLIEQADLIAHIPIETDSLNAAMAATVALYELRIRMARE